MKYYARDKKLLIFRENRFTGGAAHDYLVSKGFDVVIYPSENKDLWQKILEERPDVIFIASVSESVMKLDIEAVIMSIDCIVIVSEALSLPKQMRSHKRIYTVPLPHTARTLVRIIDSYYPPLTYEELFEKNYGYYKEKASDFVKRTGISPELSGYGYLAEAIALCLAEQSLLKQLTSGLYPRIAEKFGTTPVCVEKSIRSAVSSVSDDLEKPFLKDFAKENGISLSNRKIILFAVKTILEEDGEEFLYGYEK